MDVVSSYITTSLSLLARIHMEYVIHSSLTNILSFIFFFLVSIALAGKSSLFRMLGGLWPALGGTLRKPGKGDIYFLPQRPYLTRGTFREQFIYPDTSDDFIRKGYTDADLMKMIDIVALANVVEREGGLDASNDWRDTLSGGEKQVH
jgi:ABC-type uncharacterized transport system fused permease/ATPase subunit